MSDRRVRTLIADDSEALREKMRELVESMPEMEVVGVAVNGEEAARLSERLQPDLVIIDLQMPVMNGLEAAREMAVCAPRARVLLTSACGPEGTIRYPGLAEMEFVPKAQLWRALPEVVKQFFGKQIEN